MTNYVVKSLFHMENPKSITRGSFVACVDYERACEIAKEKSMIEPFAIYSPPKKKIIEVYVGGVRFHRIEEKKNKGKAK